MEADSANVDEENAFIDTEEDFTVAEGIDATQEENAFVDEDYEVQEGSVNLGEDNALGDVEEDFQPAEGLSESVSVAESEEQTI